MNAIAMTLWVLSVLVPAWRMGRAQRALDDGGLLLVARAANRPLATLVPILLVGAIGAVVIRFAPPAYRAAVAMVAVLLALGLSGWVLHAAYRRMENAGVPRAYLGEWRLAQWASAALFIAGAAFAFVPRLESLAQMH
jgi:TRAP-type C4-dicarboxylate transport system permease small subunit